MPSAEWSDYQIFLAVARTGQVSRAGQELRLNHATVSRRIAALENALRARLFDRSPKGYTLTEQGEQLIGSAEAMEAAALAAQSAVGGSDMRLSGTVRIGAPDGFGSYFLTPRLGAFVSQHPALEVQIFALPRIFSLSRREADIAVALARPEGGRVVSRKLTDYTLRIYATRPYLAERPAPRDVHELRRHRGIGYVQDMIFTPELDYLGEITPGLRPMVTSANLIAQLQAARAGVGICVLPDFIASGYPELVPVLGDSVILRRSFWIILHEDSRALARIRRAADFITQQCEASAALFLPLG